MDLGVLDLRNQSQTLNSVSEDFSNNAAFGNGCSRGLQNNIIKFFAFKDFHRIADV